ncbi:hypothetical protein [Spirosoma validum]|nr:hypothetical protein [Spirosoma validum]
MVACQSKPKQETETTSTTATASVDSAALLAKRPAAGAPRSASDRLVRSLYFEHNKTENPFREKKDRGLVDQFFAKPTADLIWNDAQKSSGKVNRTKTNLLFNAPDDAIKKMWVEPAAVAGTRAVVYVTFENKGKPEEIKIDLQQVAGRWRITDMLYPNRKQLTELLR